MKFILPDCRLLYGTFVMKADRPFRQVFIFVLLQLRGTPAHAKSSNYRTCRLKESKNIYL